ncbi:MAG: protein kinase [Gemmatimonadetes bacterium]|nr:protein kinase [Gemmatimonadota bacterium]
MPYCPECSASVPQGVETCPICGAALVDTPTTGDDYPAQPELDVKALEKQLSTALAPRYELLKLLGAGGMGAVFLAREAALKRLVAVKVLAPALAAYQPARVRFQREARAAAALSHPNVVRVYAVGETRGKLPYIIMQYVEGLALHDWLLQRGRVPERDARRIIGEVAAALAAAHARDLVHRDVKPANVLIETETGRAFVADFGVSAALSPAGRQETKLTSTGMIIGTPPYMSPEQAAGDAVTPKSDVYSLGILAYELLAGTLPFAANTAAGWAAAHLRDTPESVATKRSELTPQLARLVARCLAKATNDRPSAAEVARALLPSLETEIRWPPPGLGALFGRGAGFTRELLITAGAGVLVLLALAFTPHVLEVHDHWLSRFTLDPAAGAGLAQARPSPDSSQVSFFVWQTALILGSAVFLLGVFYLAAVVYWLRRALRYRALGWSWLTLAAGGRPLAVHRPRHLDWVRRAGAVHPGGCRTAGRHRASDDRARSPGGALGSGRPRRTHRAAMARPGVAARPGGGHAGRGRGVVPHRPGVARRPAGSADLRPRPAAPSRRGGGGHRHRAGDRGGPWRGGSCFHRGRAIRSVDRAARRRTERCRATAVDGRPVYRDPPAVGALPAGPSPAPRHDRPTGDQAVVRSRLPAAPPARPIGGPHRARDRLPRGGPAPSRAARLRSRFASGGREGSRFRSRPSPGRGLSGPGARVLGGPGRSAPGRPDHRAHATRRAQRPHAASDRAPEHPRGDCRDPARRHGGRGAASR